MASPQDENGPNTSDDEKSIFYEEEGSIWYDEGPPPYAPPLPDTPRPFIVPHPPLSPTTPPGPPPRPPVVHNHYYYHYHNHYDNGHDSRRRRLSGMQIFVKYDLDNGETITMNVEAYDTIETIKAIIQNKDGIPCSHQHLILRAPPEPV